MTVIFSKKCELALQSVLFLSIAENGKNHNAEEISNKLKAPKEFISKILQTLTNNGIVASKTGKRGGFYLAKDASEIKLIDIVIAIDGTEVFHKCVLGFPGCSPESPCPVHNHWGKLRDETYKMLSQETLAELKNKTLKKINSLEK